MGFSFGHRDSEREKRDVEAEKLARGIAISKAKPGSSSIPIVPISSTAAPSAKVKIQAIRDSSHPANGQYGLFAAQCLPAGSFILAYLGRVHAGASSSSESDYDLWLDKEADVAVDAAREGNEGRFVNDYRGIGHRANAVFGPAYCERWGELCVGLWVVGGKKVGKGIKKGEEILVSYGKGFWKERMGDVADEYQDADANVNADADANG
ncbi:uncharacterized protein DCS_07123 [Drechmeria coniospora]|uniref:SET domain-containing protein n=1 Tax=Drechmeria coniospora TaxID=98403 RepID=A0A151GDN0_DRECN|nr:uncharacterized protein DCS_07123 [Drechmeria coniospora]KYK55161.1 uncharacterized protein DCS_07123 [Drechmeria coniospora]